MRKQFNSNRGFTLIELLISMALLSIVMLMVVQFMSSTTAAQKKTRSNLDVQNEAMEVMNNLSDSIMQAKYVRVHPADNVAYRIDVATGLEPADRKDNDEVTKKYVLTTDKYSQITFDLVPDDYGNYVRTKVEGATPQEEKAAERDVIIDEDTFQLLAEAESKAYPLEGDLDSVCDVRSYRLLKQDNQFFYVRPEYIYIEYSDKDSTGAEIVRSVIYRFVEDGDKTKVYMVRSSGAINTNAANRYEAAVDEVKALTEKNETSNGREGLLTECMQDFYLSADTDEESFLINSVFKKGTYRYHAVKTVGFRNSNVLSVRPQNRFRKQGTGGATGGEETTTENTP